nr:hypothetical protein [Tanacetum cinerariifolium]
MLSRCSATDRGTQVMSDGCHAKMSKFFFRTEHNAVRPLSNSDPPITTSWSGKSGCRATVKLAGRDFSSPGITGDVVTDAHSTGRRWVIGHGLRLAVMKCGESVKMRQAFADVVSAGIAKALQPLKDLKYPLLDQLEGLKDAPIDVIMAALYLESDTREDAPQYICDLRPAPLSSPSPCTRKDTLQLETAVNTISHEYLLEFTSEYGIQETLHPELPRSEDRIVD